MQKNDTLILHMRFKTQRDILKNNAIQQKKHSMSHSSSNKKKLASLSLAALGVVYGDIGTSPLYTMKEVFSESTQLALTTANILGAVSVIFWGMMTVVTLKYVILILRADNRGEGGIMALTALASSAVARTPHLRRMLLATGVLGAALFYGDSVITPAISVLSAVEGLKEVTPVLDPYVLPISIVVLIGLFAMQRLGTAKVGKLFGPIIALWFIVLAVAGVVQIIEQPLILNALNPFIGLNFLHQLGWQILAILGAIVLAFTGAEALYADMGHFGKKPIRLAWTTFVLPSLAIHYMGQGALLISDPSNLENPFFKMFNEFILIPIVVLATLATVIASQAVISGTFSMTKQAMQLGLLPRLSVTYTSTKEAGQIYMPQVNWFLLVAVLFAVIGFGSSSALAGAYGIAVTITMLITTSLTFFVVYQAWNYPLWLAIAATSIFIVVDSILVAACSIKIFEGGWFPLLSGFAIFTVMTTWHRGREILMQNIHKNDPELLPFISILTSESVHRVHRTAVYLVSNPDSVPQALLHNLKHNQVLHERNIILTVMFHEIPRVPRSESVRVSELGPGFWRVEVNYGFISKPDIPYALEQCKHQGLDIDPAEISYFLSREIVIPTPGDGMAMWRESMFAVMSRNAGSVAQFFGLPHNSVIELGTRVQI